MRIIAGNLKGRKLAPVKAPGIRPTSDRVREAVFSILHTRVQGAVVADIFAGTGAMGIEALSRGAEFCLFVDADSQALALVNANLKAFSITDRALALRWDLTQNARCLAKSGRKFDLVFADPPYAMQAVENILEGLSESGALRPGALTVLETQARETVPHACRSFTLTDQRKYGKTLVSFFTFMV